MSTPVDDSPGWTTVTRSHGRSPRGGYRSRGRGFRGNDGHIGSHVAHPRASGKQPELQAGDTLGAGDSYLHLGIVPKDLADVAFEKMRTEVAWNTMHHRGTVS